MHVAEMDFEVASGIRKTLVKMINESDLGYLGPIPEVGEALDEDDEEGVLNHLIKQLRSGETFMQRLRPCCHQRWAWQG